jgi:uncharacterized OB-fold protein
MATDRLIPNTADRDTQGFFEAARRRELVVCICAGCQRVLHPPRGICDGCGGTETSWEAASGAATLYSWTVVEHQVHRSFDVPYTVVLVELVDKPGVRFVGHLRGSPDLTIGMAMRVRFDDLGDGVVLPDWEPSGDLGGEPL